MFKSFISVIVRKQSVEADLASMKSENKRLLNYLAELDCQTINQDGKTIISNCISEIEKYDVIIGRLLKKYDDMVQINENLFSKMVLMVRLVDDNLTDAEKKVIIKKLSDIILYDISEEMLK